MDEPIRFAVIGCGMLAQGTHIPHLAQSKKAVLHTCCDLSDKALATCTETFGALHTSKDWQATVANPEVQAICLATTEALRLPVIRAAAELGKPVYCEKPIAGTLEECKEVQKVVNVAGIPFCAGHNRRSAPAMQDAYRIFRGHMTAPQPCPWRFDREGHQARHLPGDGVAGLTCRINDDWYSWKNWVFDPIQAKHGPMLFEMTHFTDLCNWFLAAEPEEVVALEYSIYNHGVVIRYKTGEMATITMLANGTFGYPKELYELCGNGGFLAIDHLLEIRTAGIEGAAPRIAYPMINDRHPEVGKDLDGLPAWLAKKRAACAEAVASGNSWDIFTADPDKGHRQAIERFIDEIRGVGPVVCGVDEAVMATRVAFAAIKAAHERRAVKLDEI